MVASLKSHTISQALVYLVLTIGLIACDNSNQTIVTLHHKDPVALEKLITASVNGKAEFSITGSDIIFFTKKNSISETLELLRLLDKGPSLYKLEFKHTHSNHYTTNPLPGSITLIEGQFSKGEKSLKRNQFKAVRQSKHSSLLSIEFKKKRNTTIQYILLPHNQWRKTTSDTLPENTQIKLSLINEPKN